LALAAASLAACSSLNPFGGGSPKTAAAPAAGTEGQADAQAKPKRASESAGLARFDANGDSTVTRAELDQTLATDFKKEDANGNASLDTVELRALNERLRQEQNTSPVFDWNADGQLVFAEFATQWRTLFDRADRNRDGIVDADELKGRGSDRTPRPLPKPEMSKVDPSQ
jgi:Ca2+-binding EF-hand superfamily protein